jgi:hypothetical protein
VVTEVPTEDERRRSDRDGRFLYACAVCGRLFLSRRVLASEAGNRVSVCGNVLSPPEARCLLGDDFGNLKSPANKKMPDLLEIDRMQREALAERESESR